MSKASGQETQSKRSTSVKILKALRPVWIAYLSQQLQWLWLFVVGFVSFPHHPSHQKSPVLSSAEAFEFESKITIVHKKK